MIFLPVQAFTQEYGTDADSLMTSIYPDDKPGAAIAVIKDGVVVFKKGYGIADLTSGKSIKTSTNFNICSLTKQFTAYGILKLAEERKLFLDDRINRYFPGFNPEVAGVVTIRNLLTHSSGIVDHYGYVDKALYKEFRDKDVLDAVSQVDSFYFQPGSGYRYSNTAYCLLALIIEKVSGLSFPEFIRENIFQPLKMERSDIIKPGFRISERAFGYEPESGSFKISDAGESLFFATQGDGGIYTSVDDYLKWIIAIQNGDVLNSGLIKEAQSVQFTIDQERDLSYGYGWFVAGSGENRIIYHTGSNGGFRTIVFMAPSKKYSVVIFSNRTDIDLEDLVREINEIYDIDNSTFLRLEPHIS
jgi:CubicO group peptidase (beta-lactamase class C family)